MDAVERWQHRIQSSGTPAIRRIQFPPAIPLSPKGFEFRFVTSIIFVLASGPRCAPSWSCSQARHRKLFESSPNSTKEADMVKISALTATAGLSALLFAAALSAQTTDEAATQSQVSQNQASKVRIVRLSEVRGLVLMDRNIGRGLEAATANLPIVEGSRIQTGTGVAEIEFEDNSTLRLTPGSVVDFPQL